MGVWVIIQILYPYSRPVVPNFLFVVPPSQKVVCWRTPTRNFRLAFEYGNYRAYSFTRSDQFGRGHSLWTIIISFLLNIFYNNCYCVPLGVRTPPVENRYSRPTYGYVPMKCSYTNILYSLEYWFKTNLIFLNMSISRYKKETE